MLGPCAKYGVDEATTRHAEEEDSTHCKKERNTRDQLRTRYRRSHAIISGVGLKFACMHVPSLVGTSHGLTQVTASGETRGGTPAHKAA